MSDVYRRSPQVRLDMDPDRHVPLEFTERPAPAPRPHVTRVWQDCRFLGGWFYGFECLTCGVEGRERTNPRAADADALLHRERHLK